MRVGERWVGQWREERGRGRNRGERTDEGRERDSDKEII